MQNAGDGCRDFCTYADGPWGRLGKNPHRSARLQPLILRSLTLGSFPAKRCAEPCPRQLHWSCRLLTMLLLELCQSRMSDYEYHQD